MSIGGLLLSGRQEDAAPPGLTEYFNPVLDNAFVTGLTGRDASWHAPAATPTGLTTADGQVTRNAWIAGSSAAFRSSGDDPRLNGFRYADVANPTVMIALDPGDYVIDAAFGAPIGDGTWIQWTLRDGTGHQGGSQTDVASKTAWQTTALRYGDLYTDEVDFDSNGWFNSRDVSVRGVQIEVTDRADGGSADRTGIQLRWSDSGNAFARFNYIRIFTP